MMTISVLSATRVQLDWLVAKFTGQFDRSPHTGNGATFMRLRRANRLNTGVLFSSTDWAQGGPIIEMECIELTVSPVSLDGMWIAQSPGWYLPVSGPTPLIAAMRCYVVSKLCGDVVEVPDELA